MPRGVYKRKSAPTEQSVVTPETFTKLRGWDQLSINDQASAISEGQKLSQSLLHLGQARLQVGEHLTALQAILEPHNMFVRFLRAFRFSQRTAYRYITGYKNASARLPEAVLKAAMSRGINIVGDTEAKPLGAYTAAVEKLPPPTAATETQANTWLDQIEQVRKQTKTETAPEALPVGNPETLKKEVVRFCKLRYDRLPPDKRTRDGWSKSVISLLLAEFNLTRQAFAPLPVPVDWQVHRGRPRIATA